MNFKNKFTFCLRSFIYGFTGYIYPNKFDPKKEYEEAYGKQDVKELIKEGVSLEDIYYSQTQTVESRIKNKEKVIAILEGLYLTPGIYSHVLKRFFYMKDYTVEDILETMREV